MGILTKTILILTICTFINCSPYDDGKYSPKRYGDGKYYRPLSEGKYIHTDEGKYTYIYRQGLYPGDFRDYRYIHQIGPDDNGDYRYIHQVGPDGGFGGVGGEGGKGPNGPGGPQGPNGPTPDEYTGKKIYAERFPYLHNIIRSLIEEYVSYDALATEVSLNHFSRAFASKDGAMMCQYLDSKQGRIEFEKPHLQQMLEPENSVPGFYYSINGIKTFEKSSSSAKKLKAEFKLFIKIFEDVEENYTDSTNITD